MISKKQKTLKGSMLVVLLLMIPSMLYAACTGSSPTWSTTPDYASVNTCVKNASAGDTINFIQGTATWTNTISIEKALTINGNGTTLAAGGSMPSGFFNINGFTADSLTRITDFTFQMYNYDGYRTAICVHSMTGGVNVGQIRIDHNTFYYGYEAISFHHGKGLVDNNYFYNSMIGVKIDAGSRAYADEAWNYLAAGTANALFIEDNHFIADKVGTQEQIGSDNGGNMVVRYNEFNSDDLTDGETFTPFMSHGNADAGCNSPTNGYWQYDAGSAKCIRRGNPLVEFYNNTAHGKRIDFFFVARGSANLVYNNSITGTVKYNPRIGLREEEYVSDPSDSWSIKRTTWPAEDQVHNTFIWNNTYRGVDFNVGMYGYVEAGFSTCAPYPATCTNALQKDRDFFLHAPCGASDSTDTYGNACTHGKESFTGANGASGSYPTNGSKYPTQGTMIFTKSGDNAYYGYIPYTYPHPLRSFTENTQGFPPTIAVSPATKDFGSLPINTSSPVQKFTVTTTGGNLKVDGISMKGTDTTQFTIQNDSCTGKIIDPETGSCTFEAKFSPSSVGAKTANVSIVNNDSNTTEMIALNGTGIANQVPTLSFSPTSFLYGVLSDAWSSPQTITLSNNGAAPVTISSLTLSGTNANQFSIPIATDYCTGETVAAYGNCSFQVIFYLASTGKKTADVNVTALYYDSPASLALFGYTVIDRNKPITISKKK